MPTNMHLCLNCLGPGAFSTPVGPDKGERNIYRERIDLCVSCKSALEKGDLKTFHERYTDERTVKR